MKPIHFIWWLRGILEEEDRLTVDAATLRDMLACVNTAQKSGCKPCEDRLRRRAAMGRVGQIESSGDKHGE